MRPPPTILHALGRKGPSRIGRAAARTPSPRAERALAGTHAPAVEQGAAGEGPTELRALPSPAPARAQACTDTPARLSLCPASVAATTT